MFWQGVSLKHGGGNNGDLIHSSVIFAESRAPLAVGRIIDDMIHSSVLAALMVEDNQHEK
jgi:hypothetical protein